MEFAKIIDAVGGEWLIAMVVFFALTVWWGFGGRRKDGDGDEGGTGG